MMLDFKSNKLCKVRTITTFISLSPNKQSWENEVVKASRLCAELSKKFRDSGYDVQSVRIVTNPFGEYLDTSSLESARTGLISLGNLLNAADRSSVRVRFAIGEARNEQEIQLLPELVREFGDLCNVCVNVQPDENGILENELIRAATETVLKISQITPRGEGNFNFTVNFNCAPLIPYFPASYHRSELGNRFVIGLETPDLLVQVLREYNRRTATRVHNDCFRGYFEVMRDALQYHISTIKNLVDEAEIDADFTFSGFDSSAAPSKNCASMVEVYQQMGVEYFGASGTLEASSLLTRVFKSIKDVELVGFSGLMLALTEDTGLAKGTLDSHFDIRALLTTSAVCGIGLDTVPIPGDTPADKICALMRDTGTLAYRLDKPLTVRLFPVPGLRTGDVTAFESDDLCNCAVLAVP